MAYTDTGPAPGAVATVTGAGLGCLYFIVLLFPLVLVAALAGAHCQPYPDCRPAMSGEFLRWTLLALGPAVLLGVTLRRLFRWLGALIAAQEEAPDPAAQVQARTPWWAFVALPLALGGGTWLVWGEPFWRIS